MAYTPYLIANYSTGLDKELQPWLLPDDAQEELFDGDVYRGVLFKRSGYTPLATGQRGGAPYCESRIVNRITTEQARTSVGVLVTGNGTPGPYTFQIQNTPVRRGTVTITAGGQTATDNGVGGFTTAPAGGSGTINYTTGAVTITFLNNVAGGTQLTVTYDYHPGLPVMGLMTFITSTNVKQLLAADTKRVNLYNTTTNRLDYVGATRSINAITQANPGAVTTTAAHNLITGDRIFIYGVVGMNEVNNLEYTITVTGATTFTIGVDTSGFTAYTSGGTVELIYSGTQFNFWSWVNYKDANNNPRLIFTNNKDEVQYYAPHLTPAIGDYVNYPTAAAPEFFMNSDASPPVAITTFTALLTFEFKDRLLFLRTTENGTIKPQRIRISGTGASSDDFRTSATGAGFIDIPDGTWIQGAAFNRDDLIIFTESSTWVLKFTGNDTKPFVLNKIDESRGSQAPFATITYLNRTSAASPRGLIVSDGYRVERSDSNLPDFSYNEIDPEFFELCFTGIVDEDRDHWFLYPPVNQPSNDTKSTRVLNTNYEEDNYSIYRLPLSCMGTALNGFDVTWDDLDIYPNWDSFAAAYGDWNSFAYSSGAPFAVGGGHKGEVFRLNINDLEDNEQKIRNITIIDANTLEVTTDWNNYSLNLDDPTKAADTIYFTAVEGMVEVNGKQYTIDSITNNYTFRVTVPSTVGFTAYTGGGVSSRVIPFSALFKKFNPFVNLDQKVRCGWIYFYVSTSGTNLTRNVAMSGATQANPCVITTSVEHNFQTGDQISFISVGGMTQLNGASYFITVLSSTTFSLNGVNSTGFGAYTSGGYAVVAEKCKIEVDIITNDSDQNIQINNVNPNTLQANCTNLILEEGSKKWYKTYINQTAKFIQFRVRNRQAGSKVFIHATMPGFQPVGRLI